MSDPTQLREEFEDGLWVGEWFVEPMLNRVEQDGEEVQLEPKVMEVLLCLAERPGKTITKDQFKEEVWTDTIVTDDVLSRCISELRKVFDDNPKDPSYIETIRKTGYRLIASVDEPEDAEPVVSTPQQASTTGTIQEGEDEPGNPVQRILRNLSGGIEASSSDAKDVWVVFAGGTIRQKWMMAAGGVIGTILVVALLYWLSSEVPARGDAPLSAAPFTSFSGEEFDPALSASGKQVLFTWRNPDSLDQNVYLSQRGAERPLRLSADSTVDRSPTWSPDERFVAFVREVSGEDQVAVIPSIGGRSRVLLRLPQRRIQSIAWLPDTSRQGIVVSAQRHPHQAYSLSILFPNDDSMATLTEPPQWCLGDTDPTPSPDGSLIAFVRGTVQGVENIFVVPTSGGTPTQVTSDSSAIDGITWSSDGSTIVYAGRREGVSGLWRISPEGGSPSLIRSASEGTIFSDPTISPQSKRLVYTQKSAQLDIWKLSRASSSSGFTAESLLSSTQEDTDPSVSPDGNRIAFVSGRSGNDQVWVAQSDGSKPTQVTTLEGPTIQSVSWSPEGTHLCFVMRQNGQSDLYVVPESGGSPFRLTQSGAEDLIPRWSRDGRWIYFASNRTGNWEAWRTRASGDQTTPQQVTKGGAVAMQESPGGSDLYFVRPDTVGIWSVPLDTTSLPLYTDSLSRSKTTSIEGERVQLRHVVPQFNPQDRSDWWTGDTGIHFIQHRPDATVLSHFDPATERTRPLYEFPDWRPVQNFSVGSKGEWFAYTHVVRRESDIMLVENFE